MYVFILHLVKVARTNIISPVKVKIRCRVDVFRARTVVNHIQSRLTNIPEHRLLCTGAPSRILHMDLNHAHAAAPPTTKICAQA